MIFDRVIKNIKRLLIFLVQGVYIPKLQCVTPTQKIKIKICDIELIMFAFIDILTFNIYNKGNFKSYRMLCLHYVPKKSITFL